MHAFIFSSASRWLSLRTNTAPVSRIQEEFCPQELQESLLSHSAGSSCGMKATAAITMLSLRQYSYVNCCCFSLMWYSSSGMHAAYSSFSRSVTSYQAALGGHCPFPSSSASLLRSPCSCAAENQKFSSSDWNILSLAKRVIASMQIEVLILSKWLLTSMADWTFLHITEHGNDVQSVPRQLSPTLFLLCELCVLQ